jgi:hypothetical protein
VGEWGSHDLDAATFDVDVRLDVVVFAQQHVLDALERHERLCSAMTPV